MGVNLEREGGLTLWFVLGWLCTGFGWVGSGNKRELACWDGELLTCCTYGIYRLLIGVLDLDRKVSRWLETQTRRAG